MNWKRLIISLALPQLAGGLGSIFTISSLGSWYDFLNKPSFNPPSWLFGPVWTLLYILMGISIYLIWQELEKARKRNKDEIEKYFWLFWTHLAINASWSFFFFGLENLLAGLMVIIGLWFFILCLIIAFWRINKVASYLLWPYLAWVSFATVLNFSLWYLN